MHFVLEKSVVLEVIFYKNQGQLTSVLSSPKSLIVCPSPLIADGLRRQLPKGQEVVTISKWVSDALKEKNLKRSNKSELMLRLSSVWRHYFPDNESHLFFKSFELFTELRSFTLDLSLLSEFLKEFDETIVKSILIFWAFLENEKIIDEHKSYHEISELSLESSLYLVGFKHLSGIQIDMLKTISEKVNVFVLFPEDVYPETLSTDWIRWLVPERSMELNLEKFPLKCFFYPKNKLNMTLQSLNEVSTEFDIALASSSLTFNGRQEVARVGQFFKSPEDLFAASRSQVVEEMQEEVKEKIEINNFLSDLKGKKEHALKDENFIKYRTYILLEEALTTYSEFQSHLDQFTIVVLDLILALNSPRTALVPLINNQKARLLEMNELGLEEKVKPLVVVGSSHYGSLKTSDSKYSEKMIESLRTIAPLKRNGLDFAYLKYELANALSRPETLLLLEDGLELTDLGWREILKKFELSFIELKTAFKLKGKKDYLSSLMQKGPYPLKHISASRLQTYLDCPRKYYFSYIEKLDHRPDDRLKIAADEIGAIEHKIIEKYFLENSFKDVFNKKQHENLCQNELDKFLSDHKINLSEKVKRSTLYELIYYTKNGIEYLLMFCHSNQAQQIDFEISVGTNPIDLVGFIDCLVSFNDGQVALFDFKRSSAAIGSEKETMAFEKIQIWAYLLALHKFHGKKIRAWGYLNLSEIEKSMVFDEQFKPRLSEQVLESFEELFLRSAESLKTEVNFPGHPRKEKICAFCDVQLYCNRGCP